MAPEPALERWLRSIPTIDYVSTDLFQTEVMVQADLAWLPFRPRTFDVILCSHVLEYVADDRRAIAELYASLRPGGWAVLQFPLRDDLVATRERQPEGHSAGGPLSAEDEQVRRLYGRDYASHLQEPGFHVQTEDLIAQLDPAIVSRHALAPTGRPMSGDAIHFCRRPSDDTKGVTDWGT